MKIRSIVAAVGPFAAASARACALAAPILAAACSSPPAGPSVTAFSGPSLERTPVVLAAPADEPRAAAIAECQESAWLAARLDGTMGAPAPTIVLDDLTAIQVVDQQFTSNGRMYDSYANTRWTNRLQRR